MDISTVWDNTNARGEWQLIEGTLVEGNDLYTAMTTSLFSDRQAAEDDVIPDGSGDRRGWVGDQDAEYPIGSRLWLLYRSKQIPETLTRAYDYVTEALQWMIDDGIVSSFDINCSFPARGALAIRVTAYQPGKGAPQTFAWAWKELS